MGCHTHIVEWIESMWVVDRKKTEEVPVGFGEWGTCENTAQILNYLDLDQRFKRNRVHCQLFMDSREEECGQSSALECNDNNEVKLDEIVEIITSFSHLLFLPGQWRRWSAQKERSPMWRGRSLVERHTNQLSTQPTRGTWLLQVQT